MSNDEHQNEAHTSLKEAIETLSLFTAKRTFVSKTSQQEQKGKLLHSVDVIKIALMKLKKGHLFDHELKERMLHVVYHYNALVSGAKKKQSSLPEKIRRFFFKRASLLVDVEVQQSEIHIPQNDFYHGSDGASPHKFSIHVTDATSEKIASLEIAQKQELELFHLKAQLLLRKQSEGIGYDAKQSLFSSPIETTLTANSILNLKQTISHFPGEEIQLQGAFSRSRGISIPLKELFQITSFSKQTGFPHPLQSTGFVFCETLLPRCLFRSYLAPNVERVLEKKRKIAQQLLPNGALNVKAKTLLHLRKKIWKENQSTFYELHKKLLKALLQGIHIDVPEFVSFEKLCQFNSQILLRFIEKPLQRVEQGNLEAELFFAEVEYVKEELLLRHETTRDPQEKMELQYKLSLGSKLCQCAWAIIQLILSEELQLNCVPLDDFQRKVLAATLYQAIAFQNELEKLDVSESSAEQKLYKVIVEQFETQIELFSKKPSDPLVFELEHYYLTRHQSY